MVGEQLSNTPSHRSRFVGIEPRCCKTSWFDLQLLTAAPSPNVSATVAAKQLSI